MKLPAPIIQGIVTTAIFTAMLLTHTLSAQAANKANKAKNPQPVKITNQYVIPARDKYGIPAAQIDLLLTVRNAKEIRTLLAKVPRCAGDEDRRLMLDGAILATDDDFEQALPIFSRVKHPLEATNYEIYLAAKTFAQAQDFTRAINMATLGANRGNNHRCLEIRASCYSNLNRFPEAVKDYDTLACTQPLWATDYLSKEADLLLRINKCNEALAVTERAEKLDGRKTAPTFTRGLCLERLDRFNEAIEAFTKSMQNTHEKIEQKRESAYFFLNALRERAKCYRKLGRIKDAAIDEFEAAKISKGVMDELIGK